MHYILCRILLPHLLNLAQASKEDLILLWALQTSHQIDWVHLVRYRMHKALHQIGWAFFLQHFNVPLDVEPFVKVKHSFAIGATIVASFGYRMDMDGQWVRKQDLPPTTPDERTPSPQSFYSSGNPIQDLWLLFMTS